MPAPSNAIPTIFENDVLESAYVGFLFLFLRWRLETRGVEKKTFPAPGVCNNRCPTYLLVAGERDKIPENPQLNPTTSLLFPTIGGRAADPLTHLPKKTLRIENHSHETQRAWCVRRRNGVIEVLDARQPIYLTYLRLLSYQVSIGAVGWAATPEVRISNMTQPDMALLLKPPKDSGTFFLICIPTCIYFNSPSCRLVRYNYVKGVPSTSTNLLARQMAGRRWGNVLPTPL